MKKIISLLIIIFIFSSWSYAKADEEIDLEGVVCGSQALDPSDYDYAPIQNSEGEKAFKKGDYKQALKCFKNAIESEPDYIQAHSNMAVTYEKLGALDLALSANFNALYYAKNNERIAAATYYNLGNVYAKMGNKIAAFINYQNAYKTMDYKVYKDTIARYKKEENIYFIDETTTSYAYQKDKKLANGVYYKNYYGENGVVVATYEIKNGVKNGVFKRQYAKNGLIIVEGIYKNDLIDGEVKLYDIFGDLNAICTYKDGEIIQCKCTSTNEVLKGKNIESLDILNDKHINNACDFG